MDWSCNVAIFHTVPHVTRAVQDRLKDSCRYWKVCFTHVAYSAEGLVPRATVSQTDFHRKRGCAAHNFGDKPQINREKATISQ